MIEQNETGSVEPATPERAKLPTVRKYEKNPDRVTCKARSSRTGDPCNNPPMKGATVCRMHGGAAPQTKAAARVRLEMAADRMAAQLLKMAADDAVNDSVKLSAIRDALDRAGLGAKHAVELEVGPTKAYEALLTEMVEGGSRAESRAARGMEEAPDAEPWRDYLEAELVDAQDLDENADGDALLSSPAPSAHGSARSAPAESARGGDTDSRTDRGTDSGLMNYQDALDQLRATAPPPAPQARRRGRR